LKGRIFKYKISQPKPGLLSLELAWTSEPSLSWSMRFLFGNPEEKNNMPLSLFWPNCANNLSWVGIIDRIKLSD